MIDRHPSHTAARLNHRSIDAARAPACGDCGTPMTRAELRIPRPRSNERAGAAPRPPRSLPVWRCPVCGCQQPRLES